MTPPYLNDIPDTRPVVILTLNFGEILCAVSSFINSVVFFAFEMVDPILSCRISLVGAAPVLSVFSISFWSSDFLELDFPVS